MITVHNEDSRQTVEAVLLHLRTGGTHMAGSLLANQLQNACNAQAIEAARQKEIRDAVAQSKIDTALTAKPADPILANPTDAGQVVPANDPVPVARAARRGKASR